MSDRLDWFLYQAHRTHESLQIPKATLCWWLYIPFMLSEGECQVPKTGVMLRGHETAWGRAEIWPTLSGVHSGLSVGCIMDQEYKTTFYLFLLCPGPTAKVPACGICARALPWASRAVCPATLLEDPGCPYVFSRLHRLPAGVCACIWLSG